MDEKERELRELTNYINALENKLGELMKDLEGVQEEKEELFNEYIESLERIYGVGGKDVSKDIS